jgi:putative membrane protein insertion efficiency factor
MTERDSARDSAQDEPDADDDLSWRRRRDRPLGFVAWLLASLLIAPVRIYQTMISPLFGPTCRFQPTCSQYFIESVKKHGPVRGAWRGLCRIARCHPFHPGGYDPP